MSSPPPIRRLPPIVIVNSACSPASSLIFRSTAARSGLAGEYCLTGSLTGGGTLVTASMTDAPGLDVIVHTGATAATAVTAKRTRQKTIRLRPATPDSILWIPRTANRCHTARPFCMLIGARLQAHLGVGAKPQRANAHRGAPGVVPRASAERLTRRAPT